MSDPIRIHAADTDDQVKERHDRVVARLEELGPSVVGMMAAKDELPQAWHPIIREWLGTKDGGRK